MAGHETYKTYRDMPGFFNIAGATNKEHRLASLPRCEAGRASEGSKADAC